MSLDVYLELHGLQPTSSRQAIYIRENGATREISRSEWDERHPGIEPVVVNKSGDDSIAYHANITHNLGKMAEEAGIYEHLWRPGELGIEFAEQMIGPLGAGLELLRNDPARFRQFNPANGWGDYEGLVSFVSKYLAACILYPTARISTSQ